jgi:hypothetical protein
MWNKTSSCCPPSPILPRCAQYIPNFMLDIKNTFFTKEIYDSEIGLHINKVVLSRIYGDGIRSETKLPIEFVFVSNEEQKLKNLGLTLLSQFPTYTDLKIKPYNNNFDLLGVTHPIQMELETINEWNQQMWDFGYRFDCKLDGWQVGT